MEFPLGLEGERSSIATAVAQVTAMVLGLVCVCVMGAAKNLKNEGNLTIKKIINHTRGSSDSKVNR